MGDEGEVVGGGTEEALGELAPQLIAVDDGAVVALDQRRDPFFDGDVVVDAGLADGLVDFGGQSLKGLFVEDEAHGQGHRLGGSLDALA